MDKHTLSPEERLRYARHLTLPGVGEQGQLRLIVGCGENRRVAILADVVLHRRPLRWIPLRKHLRKKQSGFFVTLFFCQI